MASNVSVRTMRALSHVPTCSLSLSLLSFQSFFLPINEPKYPSTYPSQPHINQSTNFLHYYFSILLILQFNHHHHIILLYYTTLFTLHQFLLQLQPVNRLNLTRILLCLLRRKRPLHCPPTPGAQTKIDRNPLNHLPHHPSSPIILTSFHPPQQCQPTTTHLSIISPRQLPHILPRRRIITTAADHEERLGSRPPKTRIAHSVECEA